MALIDCPECTRHVSEQAVACPDCAYPIVAARKPRVVHDPKAGCPDCGGRLKRGYFQGANESTGQALILLGDLLIPLLIGIPIALYGHSLVHGNACWRCRACTAEFPRDKRWWHLW